MPPLETSVLHAMSLCACVCDLQVHAEGEVLAAAARQEKANMHAQTLQLQQAQQQHQVYNRQVYISASFLILAKRYVGASMHLRIRYAQAVILAGAQIRHSFCCSSHDWTLKVARRCILFES